MQQGVFYMHFHTDRTALTTAFDRPIVDHWLEWKIAKIANAPTMHARLDDPNLYRRVLYPFLHFAHKRQGVKLQQPTNNYMIVSAANLL